MTKFGYKLRRGWLRLSGRVRRHSVFLSLGRSCETAFRYYRSHGFLESAVFQWAGYYRLELLLDALEHWDRLFTGGITGPSPLYTCNNTQLLFHGKAPTEKWVGGITDANRAEAEADHADTLGRMLHLKEKFRTQIRTPEALLTYKMRREDWFDDACEARVRKLYDLLVGFGAGDFDFVIILEDPCRAKKIEFDMPRTFIRYVREFNPEDRVTDVSLGDDYGWRLIFDEFAPREKKAQKHKFKFEK